MCSVKISTSNVVLFLVLVIGEVSSEVLLKKGWFRTHRKGPRTVFGNVERIDNSIVQNPTYLRVNARIHTLFPGSVKNLNRLTVLKFSFCAIDNIMPGAFVNLPNLATLALPDNEIDHIKTGVFNNLNITTLYLQRNQIKIIDQQAFDNMPNLYKLKINANMISAWDSNWFHNTPSLTEIIFRRNEIQKIPNNAFKNINGSHIYNGTYIVDTKIYLSKNNISVIEPEAFQGLGEISQLWLDRNQISKLDENVFSTISQIGALFLSKNKLANLPTYMFPKLNADVDILDLTSNNNISCISYDIVSVVKLTNIQDIRRLNCKCIDEVVNRLLEEKKVNEIKTDCQRGEL
ncbi:hypothetical protein NQ314_006170 [Rhamnusium bicolor]|uniref:Uncharacterized protein n=1 Tax=Rhamnusium bicolor TaxID=1586634 RepID=A0AAV8Z7F1_9CUCU|nr:hypothetical protein NQ314_006170 [Rhamnusium bicolor]